MKNKNRKPLPHKRHNNSNDRHFQPRDHKKKRKPEKTIKGTFCGTSNGYGFVTIEGLDEDIFIPEGNTLGALDKDQVTIAFHSYYNSYGEARTEGRVISIDQEYYQSIVGTLLEPRTNRNGPYAKLRLYPIQPDNKKISLPLFVEDATDSMIGHKVEVVLPKRDPRNTKIIGNIIHDFGKEDSKEANYNAILAECEVETEFTKEELIQAEFMSSLPISLDGREDYREKLILTIDGPYAKDLDDAISLEELPNGNVLLGVHIANVSTYVKAGSALDRLASRRGTSIYFADKVIPMLPQALSNGSCSLNPNEDKYALTCNIELTKEGRVVTRSLHRTIIRSSVRGVYFEVNDLFENKEQSPYYEKYQKVFPMLLQMHDLFLSLQQNSIARGVMELESDDSYIMLDDEGMPVQIVPQNRGDAEKMIEQFMLCANENVALYLNEREIPCVYRVHENPPEDKKKTFVRFAHNLDFDTTEISKKDATSAAYSALLEEAQKRGIGTSISYILLRSMAKAVYSSTCSPHFGLGLNCYCHFTSPIRRYSDLATHRIIEGVLFLEESPKIFEKFANKAATYATEGEVKALNAERKIEALYKTIYMSYHLGEEFDAVVSSCTKFGLFATLANTCEGLVPLSEMPGYYEYDEEQMILKSFGGPTYSIGDLIRIRVEEASISESRVRFSIIK